MEEDKNYINMIHGDLERATQVQSGMPENVGVMNIKTANRTILEASQKPTPRSLWDCFWYEGELSCLFADSNVGKSILAVQIADRIAQTDNVLYLDFELSEKQFQLRYTNEHGNLYSFPKGCTVYPLIVIPSLMPTSRRQSSVASSRWHCKRDAGYSSLTTLPICAVPWKRGMPQDG